MKTDKRPEAYITGYTKFSGIRLLIDERVFVPNPETELLAGLARDYLQQLPAGHKLLVDVGTGSANLAIALATGHPDWDVIGTDLSPEALEVARINVATHNLGNVKLIETHLVAALHTEPDLIVCNLPWGKAEYMLKSNSAEALAFMPPIAIYPSGGIIRAYLELCRQVNEKKWETVIYAEVGRIPEQVIREEMPVQYQWTYHAVNSNYAVLIIYFKTKNV